MKRIKLFLLGTLIIYGTRAASSPDTTPQRPWKSSSAFLIHSLTAANIGSLIGMKIAKERAYKDLRATLLEQIENEAERVAARRTEKDAEFEAPAENPTAEVRQPTTPSEILIHVKYAPKSELVRIAQDIVQRRKAYEQLYGNFALAHELGAEQNDRERAEVVAYERLTKKIKLYERWIPQLSVALLGTGTATIASLLRQVGFVS